MTKLYNRSEEKQKRRNLRSNMPHAEVMLWSKLKGKQLSSHKFRRQFSIGRYVVDFYSPQLKLAIEIDGDSHFTEEAEVRDKERQLIIESYGFTFLRFTNREIYENIDGVLEQIRKKTEELTSLPPCISPC